MLEAFSFNREYDYVRLEGLSRATGRPAHEWDLYILKELIDNALDADETLWQTDATSFPDLHIRIEYIDVPPPLCRQLLIRVANRAEFPVENIPNIFATQWYTSRKAFIKCLTRGTLGNALKTLLGIPYALHNRVADDWKPDLKPLSICCNGTEYLPRYIVDTIAQSIDLECETRTCQLATGTIITIGLDYFVQEIPRTLAEIEILAQQYHLCNPHAEFHWSVEMDEHVWTREYSHKNWANKFQGSAPIQWYSLTAFKDLLGALYREQFGAERNDMLPIKDICQYFPGFDEGSSHQQQVGVSISRTTESLGQESLTVADINGSVAAELYKILGKYNPRFDASQLGFIGTEYVQVALLNALPVEGDVHYKTVIEKGKDSDNNIPFVIEIAMARLKEGKRQIWTAINFSPTYSDPFLSRWLRPALQLNEPALGLRGLLDAYDFHEDTPVILFLHLICPTIEHTEFSKTEINHLPFEKALRNELDQVVTALRQSEKEKEQQLEQLIFRALDAILNALDKNERFVVDQLLEQLRLYLGQDQVLASWLERPEAMSILQMYLASYQGHNPKLSLFVAYQSEAMLHLPSHPTHYISIPIVDATSDLLNQHYINKILFVQERNLVPMVLANNWLCQMDMALLHVPLEPNILKGSLLQCLYENDLPILVLHDAEEKGYALVEQMRIWLQERQIDTERIVDLIPQQEMASRGTTQPTKQMPHDLKIWLLKRFNALGIPVKNMPSRSSIRRDISDRFKQLLQGYLLERIGQRFGVTDLIIDLDEALAYTKMMIGEALDEQLKIHLTHIAYEDAYPTMLNLVVERFFEHFMDIRGVRVQQMEQTWFTRRQGDQTR